MLPLVWTKRVLTMTNKFTAFIATLILIGFSNPCFSQQIPEQFSGGSMISTGAPNSQDIQLTSCSGCGLPAASCGCGDGFNYSTPCSGACGGVCGGGCGANSHGALSGLLSGGGLGSSLLGGVGSAFGMNGGWLDAEYLLWWNQNRRVPVLASQSPIGTPIDDAGVLGQASTTNLFGGGNINSSPNSGFRISTGTWVDQWQSYGVGGRYYFISGEEDFSSSSDGDPILARPFFDTVTAAETALLVAYPGVNSGSIDITATNELRGFDVYIRKLLLSGYCNRLDLIGGYHNSTIEDSVDIRHSITGIDGTRVPIDTTITTRDVFEVTNQFNGGFVGLLAESGDGRLSWSSMAKIAFGNMNQEANIRGSTTTSVPGAGSATSPFGILALPTNIGTIEQDEFAFIPEFNVSVRYNLTNRMSVSLGYTFIYFSEVALAGDVIDTNVNTNQLAAGPLAGPASPTASIVSDDFWYTGLSFGGSFRF